MRIPNVRCVLVRDGSVNVDTPSAHHAEGAARIFRERMKNLPCEEIHVLYLNARNKVTGAEMVSRGGISGTSVSPRDIFRGAVIANASAIIMAHNHPSGELSPSPEDLTMTRAIGKAGEVLGIRVLDHLIVCPENEGAYFNSLADHL